MSSKKQLAMTLALANGMELSTEGTHVWSTPANAGVLMSKMCGSTITPAHAQEVAINAGWVDFAGALYGSLDALMKLLDTACGMEATNV